MAEPRPSWFIQPFVDEGLGNSSYLVGSREQGVAAVVDPLRDVDRYLAAARDLGVEVTHVLDTHLHADFVTGAREIAAKTGATIGASAAAQLAYNHRPLGEGDTVAVGDLTLAVLETPGHTPEHLAFAVRPPEATKPSAVFTGGALIVGGAARTDLLTVEMTEPLARQLYRAMHEKLLALPDAVTVLPTHGPGSFCSAPVSRDRVTTIGRERSNALARATSEEEFVRLATQGLPSYPRYFRELRAVNQRGPKILGGVPDLAPIAPSQVRELLDAGGAVLDTRSTATYARGHVPGSYCIGSEAWVTTWVGWLVPFGTPLALVSEGPEDREDAVRQLIRIGYDDLRGYLDGGVAAWAAAGLPLATVEMITAAELHRRLQGPDPPRVLDVRFDSEWRRGHIPGAVHVEAGRIPWEDLPLSRDRPVAVHCAHGGRSMAGISALARKGFPRLIHIAGGFSEWQAAGFEVER